jgi:hypothetical protein
MAGTPHDIGLVRRSRFNRSSAYRNEGLGQHLSQLGIVAEIYTFISTQLNSTYLSW